jgi:UPF0271 protein
VPRKVSNSVITSADAVAARVSQFLDDGTVTTMGGRRIKVRAKSILVHSDTPGSAKLARTVRDVVEAGGGKIVPATELVG